MENKIRELLEKRKYYQVNSDAVNEFKIIEELLATYKKYYGDTSDEYIVMLNEYGGTSKYIGEYTKGLSQIEIAKKIIKEKYTDDSIMYATTLLNEIEIYRFMNKLDNLEEKYLKVISIYDKNNMKSEYEYAGVCNNLGLYYQNIGQYSKALEYHNISYSILNKRLDKKVEFATTLNNMVVPLKKLNDKETALKYINKALDIYAKELGKNHSNYASSINNLAIFYLEEKEYEKAYKNFLISLKICKKSFGENSINYKNILENVEFVKSLLPKVEITKNSSGMSIVKKYYEENIKDRIYEANFQNKVIIGLFGNGSECYGYDDETSKDHDFSFMPIILLKDEYMNEMDTLDDILKDIPTEYLGFKMYSSDIVKERRGVHIYSGYISRFITDNILEIPEHCLSELTNGEIFLDTENTLTDLRYKYMYYNKDITLYKLANTCYKIHQTAQYNLKRMYNRNDTLGIMQVMSLATNNIATLVYILNNEYTPYYKWKMHKLKELPILGEATYERLLEINQSSNNSINYIENKIFELCYILIEEMKKQYNLRTNSLYIYDYINEICDKIENDTIRQLSVWSV